MHSARSFVLTVCLMLPIAAFTAPAEADTGWNGTAHVFAKKCC